MKKKFQPKEYQKLITNFQLENPRCAIWAGMGLGKTSSTLAAVDRAQLCGESTPTLVLAPLLVAEKTWVEEAGKWEEFKHLQVMPIIGSEADRVSALRTDANVFTINYENLPWLVDYVGDKWPFRRVISDESTRLKSFRTRQGGVRARALGKVAHSKIDNFVELTGTSCPNGLQDLWGQIWMIDAGRRLGRSYTAFTDRWFRRGYDGFSLQPLPHAQDEIEGLLQDVCLTIRSSDWFDLEEPIVTNKYFNLPASAAKLYREMEKEFFIEVEGHQVEAATAAIKSQKLMQIASGAVYVDPHVDSDHDPRSKQFKTVHDVKIHVLESIINEAAGMPVLVAYHFRSDKERLAKAFPKGQFLTKDNVGQVCDEWNAGKIPVLFAHPASAGHGLSLQHGGNILVYFSHSWNLENRLQMLERIGPVRQMQSGYERPVFVYNIVAQGTMDEVVMARNESKISVQEALYAAMVSRRKQGVV